MVELDYDTGKLATKFVQRRRLYCHAWIKLVSVSFSLLLFSFFPTCYFYYHRVYISCFTLSRYWIPDFGIKERIDHILLALVAVKRVLVLNTVRSRLPFVVTTTDDAKDSVKEEIRLWMSLRTI
nr:uncharacterized protein LOC113737004 isoform X1 [Coffea arabica]